MKKFLLFLAALCFSALRATSLQAADDGFQPLFNGKDLTGWHVRKPDAKNAWKVQDSVLKNDLAPGEHGVDLITDKKFWNFTVRYEYMIPKGSNSGFYLRGRHEIQILGDQENPTPRNNGDGGIYKVHTPTAYASKAAPEWNKVEATIVGHLITVTINGQKIHDKVECKIPTGSELDKLVDQPGSIFLQGDHGAVSFRNIEIKELPAE